MACEENANSFPFVLLLQEVKEKLFVSLLFVATAFIHFHTSLGLGILMTINYCTMGRICHMLVGRQFMVSATTTQLEFHRFPLYSDCLMSEELKINLE